jgi:hypothetical protein
MLQILVQKKHFKHVLVGKFFLTLFLSWKKFVCPEKSSPPPPQQFLGGGNSIKGLLKKIIYTSKKLKWKNNCTVWRCPPPPPPPPPHHFSNGPSLIYRFVCIFELFSSKCKALTFYLGQPSLTPGQSVYMVKYLSRLGDIPPLSARNSPRRVTRLHHVNSNVTRVIYYY